MKSCKQKWEIEEAKKPLKDRRPVPEPPKNFDEIKIGGGAGGADMEKYNQEAF